MPRNLVLFDLEWNIGYQPYTFNYHGVQQTLRGEIVEIGAVKIDEDANVLDTFSIHLRPRIFRKLQHHIAKVTGLTQADLDKGEPIVQGLRRFMQWCGPDAEFAEWGLDDVPVLKQNLFLCNLDESRPTQWYDLQQIFLREHPRKEGEGMTLESVVTRMGIPMERPFHDALSDTLYTADVCRLLDLRAGLAAYPTEDEALRQSLCQNPGDYPDFTVFHGYVEQYAWRADPKISQMPCPECGTTLQPDEIWLKKGSNSWYTLCQCPSCTGSGNAAGPSCHGTVRRAGRGTAEKQKSGRCSERNCKPGNVHLSDFKYFFPAADTGQRDCIPQPVWQRASNGHCRTGTGGNGSKHGSGCFILQMYGKMQKLRMRSAQEYL